VKALDSSLHLTFRIAAVRLPFFHLWILALISSSDSLLLPLCSSLQCHWHALDTSYWIHYHLYRLIHVNYRPSSFTFGLQPFAYLFELFGLLKSKRPTWCHLLFYFTSYVLNMFRTLIYPSSGACDYSVELPHWSIVLGSMCVGVSVWLSWSGIRVAGFGH